MSVYGITKRFPAKAKFGLTIRARRTAKSIAANIAEGRGRGSRREYIQFFSIARGSFLELESHLVVARQLSYFTDGEFEPAEETIANAGKMLNKFIRALKTYAGSNR